MIARWGEMWLPAIVSEKDCLINEKCKECVIWQVAEVDRSFLQNFVTIHSRFDGTTNKAEL